MKRVHWSLSVSVFLFCCSLLPVSLLLYDSTKRSCFPYPRTSFLLLQYFRSAQQSISHLRAPYITFTFLSELFFILNIWSVLYWIAARVNSLKIGHRTACLICFTWVWFFHINDKFIRLPNKLKFEICRRRQLTLLFSYLIITCV